MYQILSRVRTKCGFMASKIKEKPRVCFYGLYCYPLFNPEYKFQFGGWETRMSLIAKELARRGSFNITMIVADYGQPHVEYRDGVRLISWMVKKGGSPAGNEIARSVKKRLHGRGFSGKTRAVVIYLAKELFDIAKIFHRMNLRALRRVLSASKIPIKNPIRKLVRFLDSIGRSYNIFGIINQDGFHIIWRKDFDVFDEVNADIYVVPGNHRMSAVAAYYCQVRKKKFVFLAGSEYDYYPEYKTDPNGRDIYGEAYFLKTYAIEHASVHIVQTQRQAAMLEQGYGPDSTVIHNPINLNIVYPRSTAPESILWVGKSDERVKRPSLVLELARRMPNLPFVIIMNQGVPETHEICLKEAGTLPNVTLIERVPFEEIESYYAAARLFVNTSVFEGFPNTFLQAAKYGVPIVSTDVDPNNMLSQHGCGITCGDDFERFVEGVRGLIKDDDLYAKMSAGALNYVRTYHDKDMVIAQYEKAFREVLAR